MHAKKSHPHDRFKVQGRFLVRLGMVLGSLCVALWSGRAAVTDFLPDEAAASPRYVELSPKSESHALAIAYFIRGLLDEETDGPEKAFTSFRKVLDLDPGFVDLAIRVAHEHLRHGKSAEALAVLKDALKARPKAILCALLSRPSISVNWGNPISRSATQIVRLRLPLKNRYVTKHFGRFINLRDNRAGPCKFWKRRNL